jgi:hypothetical protein
MFQAARHLVEVIQAVNDNVLPNHLWGKNKTFKKEGSSLKGENFNINS